MEEKMSELSLSFNDYFSKAIDYFKFFFRLIVGIIRSSGEKIRGAVSDARGVADETESETQA